jgi:hypothetical protein
LIQKQREEKVGRWTVVGRRRGGPDLNGRSQMQGGKNLILPKDINANRFF